MSPLPPPPLPPRINRNVPFTAASFTAAGDTRGAFTCGTGASGTTSGALVIVTFNSIYSSAPVVVVSPTNSAAATLGGGIYVTTTASGFAINVPNSPPISTTFTFNYHVIG